MRVSAYFREHLQKSVLVIGGGVAGLSVARQLHQFGTKVGNSTCLSSLLKIFMYLLLRTLEFYISKKFTISVFLHH